MAKSRYSADSAPLPLPRLLYLVRSEVIGTSPEWVTRMLARWRDSGIVSMTGPRSLVLLDIPTLKSLCRRKD